MPLALDSGTRTTKRPGIEHLLGETRALHADRVLRDLADDRLAGPQQVLDPGRAWVALDPFVTVGLDVAPVQDGVLRRADVDERGLHPRQDVLHPAAVDVAVDLVGVVEGPGDVVLDERAALEHGDLGGVLGDVHAHEVAPDRAALAFPAPTPARRRTARLSGVVRLPADRFGAGGAARRLSARAHRPARSRLRPRARIRVSRRVAARRDPWPPRRRRRGFGGPAGLSPFPGARPPDRRCRPGVADLRLRRGLSPAGGARGV